MVLGGGTFALLEFHNQIFTIQNGRNVVKAFCSNQFWITHTEFMNVGGNICRLGFFQSSVFMLELLHDMGKSCAEMMWCAAVGLTSQFIDQLVSVEAYTNVCIDRMRPFIRKFAPRKSIEQTRRDGVLKITFDKEFVLNF